MGFYVSLFKKVNKEQTSIPIFTWSSIVFLWSSMSEWVNFCFLEENSMTGKKIPMKDIITENFEKNPPVTKEDPDYKRQLENRIKNEQKKKFNYILNNLQLNKFSYWLREENNQYFFYIEDVPFIKDIMYNGYMKKFKKMFDHKGNSFTCEECIYIIRGFYDLFIHAGADEDTVQGLLVNAKKILDYEKACKKIRDTYKMII